MNAPAVFQRLEQKVLSKMVAEADNFVAAYLGDVLCFTVILEHLRKVFSCLLERC